MINKAMIIGNVGNIDELKVTPSGMEILNFSVATKKTNKAKEEKTTWHNVTCFAKTAKAMAQYLVVGKQVFVEGEIDNQSWTKTDGTKGYKSIISAHSIQLLGKKDESGIDKQDEKHIERTITSDDIPF